ncbi:MAG: helix-turn-helix domain-containing protein [Candidatus Paceibacterota bacterium]
MIGLTKNELKVFNAVTRNPQTVALIVRTTKMPRMTTYTILLRLEKKGLVKHATSDSGNKVLWLRNQDSAIEKELLHTGKVLLGSSVGNGAQELQSFSGIHFFSGKKEVSQALMDLTIRKDGIRMYSIQNSRNWPRWVDLMGKTWVNEHNKAVVKHKLVCFTIHSPDAPEGIKKDSDIIEAYKGRLGNSHAIPESFLKRDIAFYIFEDTIFLVNLEKGEAVSFTNADMASFLIKMFSFMFEKGNEEEFFLNYNR